MGYSIIVPCFNERDNIQILYKRVKQIVEPLGQFEIIFVDDGSTDDTLDKIKKIRSEDTRVKYLSFLNNYGHQKAIFAGLQVSRYDYAVTMDADLQHPPEFIPKLIKEQNRTNAQIVVGRRCGLQKGLFKNIFSQNFYRIFEWSTGLDMQPGISDFRLYTRKAIDIICSIEEQEPFLRGMVSNLRFKLSIIDYDLQERHTGKASYNFGKSLRMALSALLRFSAFPIKAGIVVGVLGVLLSLWEALHYLYLRVFTNVLIPGQAELMVFLGLMGSMILLLLSLLLKMNMQIMNSQRRQPIYIIKEKETGE